MTIDEQAFEMTLEVLGWDGSEGPGKCSGVRSFFAEYDTETTADLKRMRQMIDGGQWEPLRRLCHTWKGRNSQIGFRKCARLSQDFHDFLSIAEPEDHKTIEQANLFFSAIEHECQIIRECLRLHQILE